MGSSPCFLIEATYGGIKPCLHGSDAHKLDDVLQPPQDRFCWIRADLTFTGLKQTLIEPDLRVAIGPQPPSGPSPRECIRSVQVTGAPWLETASIELNDGLVAIVGPKGSGKTALADVIARAAGASIQDQSSFLLKAKRHLGDAVATLHWADDTTFSTRSAGQALSPLAQPKMRTFLVGCARRAGHSLTFALSRSRGPIRRGPILVQERPAEHPRAGRAGANFLHFLIV